MKETTFTLYINMGSINHKGYSKLLLSSYFYTFIANRVNP